MDAEKKLELDLDAARAASAEMSSRTSPVYVRDYLISYRIVEKIDNQGEVCGFCQEGPVDANTYVHIHRHDQRGTDVEVFETCTACVLPCLDGEWDVASEYMIIVERVAS